MNSVMETIETARRFDPYVHSRSIDDAALAEQALAQREWEGGWRRVIEMRLAELSRKRGTTIDQITYPTELSIRVAVILASRMMRALPPPDRVVPNGDGGVVMEFDKGFHLIELEIDADGTTRIRQFTGLDLTSEDLVPLPAVVRQQMV